jgi:hypothetical protein
VEGDLVVEPPTKEVPPAMEEGREEIQEQVEKKK